MHHVNLGLTFRLRLPRGICIGGRDHQTWVWSTFISARYLLGAYFLAVYRYKRMRLITRVYGNVWVTIMIQILYRIMNPLSKCYGLVFVIVLYKTHVVQMFISLYTAHICIGKSHKLKCNLGNNYANNVKVIHQVRPSVIYTYQYNISQKHMRIHGNQ